MNTIQEYIQKLNTAIIKEPNDLYEIEDLCEELEKMSDREMAIKSLFIFMENNAGEDLGSPGCIVKLLETFPIIYESELYDSIHRKPTFYNLWMLNRYLNSLNSKSEKVKGLSLLRNISNDASQTDYIRERATDFLANQ